MTQVDIQSPIKQRASAFTAIFRLPYLPLWLAPLVLLSPVLIGNAMYWGTPFLQFIPWRMEALAQLQAGVLPLWNPLVGMGAPLAANYQSALFYPANWLMLLLGLGGAAWMAWSQALLVALHLALAGIGMARLAKALGLNVIGQTVAGLAFGLCGYMVARSGFLSINAAAAWTPWLVLGADRIASPVNSPHRFRIAQQILLLALVSALLLLAGHAQTAFYAFQLAALWLVVGALRSGWRGLPRALGLFALGAGLGALIAGVQLIPTAEYLLQSQRSGGVDYEFAMNYSFFPLRLITLIAPNLLGTPANGTYLLNADNYWEDALYLGLLPLLLALWVVWRTVFARRKSPHAGLEPFRLMVITLAVLMMVTFVLAMGSNTPVFPFLYRHIPSFDMFQAPARYTLWVEFALALLAGLGASLWHRPVGKARRALLRGIVAAVAVLIGSAAAWFVLPADLRAIFVPSMAAAGLIAVAAGMLALRAPIRQSAVVRAPVLVASAATTGRWMLWVTLLLSVDLLVANWGILPGASPDLYRQIPEDAALVQQLDGHRLYLDPDDENVLKFDRFFQMNDFTPREDLTNLRRVLLPNSAMLVGAASANNFEPLAPGRYVRWMKFIDHAGADTLARWLPRMDVGLVETVDESQPDGVRFDPINDAARLRWTCSAVGAISEEDAWAKVTGGETGLVLEDSTGGERCLGTDASAQIELVSQRADELKVTVSAPVSGWLVVADTWYPGWRAWIDGVETPILHADYLFRAVALASGEHHLRFAYRPLSFTLGWISSLAGLLAVGLLAIRARVQPGEAQK